MCVKTQYTALESGISCRQVLRRRFPETGDEPVSSPLDLGLRLWTADLFVSLHDIISDMTVQSFLELVD